MFFSKGYFHLEYFTKEIKFLKDLYKIKYINIRGIVRWF